MAAVNVGNGDYTQFNQTNTNFSDAAEAAVSSASIPGVFPPHEWNGKFYMDGGTLMNINILSGVQQCKEMGYDNEDIIVDVMICGDPEITPWTEERSTLWNLLRSYKIKIYNNGLNGYKD